MSNDSLRRFFFGPSRRTGKKSKSVQLQVEGLEERRTPVSANWNVVDGVLTVSGSGQPFVNDRILLRQSGSLLEVIDMRSGFPVIVQIGGSPSDPSGRTINTSVVTGILVDGGPGNDLIDLNSTAAGFASITISATLVGRSGSDSLAGGDGNDSIVGGDNPDLIFGNEGNDTIDGGTFNDIIFGSAGDDSILGGSGEDLITGNDGNDFIDGGDGNDSILGLTGADTLLGGLGNDTLRGGDNADSMVGGGNDDFLFGELGTDILYGDDTAGGGSGNDFLRGDQQDDSLIGGGRNHSVPCVHTTHPTPHS